MRERIDVFRSQPQETINPPGVAITGTPGIGGSICSLPVRFSRPFQGKTCFLGFYLACELSQSKPAIVYRKGRFTFFFGHTNGCRAYSTKTVPDFDSGFKDILCLVDADASDSAPDSLLHDSPLFVLMAASSKKAHTHLWMKQRAEGSSRLFVMNPPSEDELVRASV